MRSQLNMARPSWGRRQASIDRSAVQRVHGLKTYLRGTGMTLSDIADTGTFIGAVGVFISLIYLALQVRQAELNQRSMASQGVAARITGIVQWSAEPHITSLRTRVLQGDTDFTAEELLR